MYMLMVYIYWYCPVVDAVGAGGTWAAAPTLHAGSVPHPPFFSVLWSIGYGWVMLQ